MPSRRTILAGGMALAGLLPGTALSAAEKMLTPRQTAGPYYPEELPLDSDNDLVRVAGRESDAKGTVAHIFGQVLMPDGRPHPAARVEIWQCDAEGRYHHPRDRGGRADPNFQGFGATQLNKDGAFRFRTIEPVPYPGRPPHIHFAVRLPDNLRPFITQMYIKGHPLNEGDGLLNAIRDPEVRARLLVDLKPAPELEAGALAGRFDIVLLDPAA